MHRFVKYFFMIDTAAKRFYNMEKSILLIKLWEMKTMKFIRMTSVLFVLLLSLSVLLVPARAAEVSIVEDTAVLYGLDDWAKEFISIPSACAQSFQIQVENASQVSYQVYSGSSVKVSDTGLVTPACITRYWYYSGGSYMYSTTTKLPDQECIEITNEMVYGTSKIRVRADGAEFTVTVEVKDYADTYTDQVIDRYIQENFTEDMTVQETLRTICKFPAGYDYDDSYSSATGMVVSGGGDCWASTDLILEVCERLGLDAKDRNGNRDPGAGSGHRNVLVTIGEGEYYELEAGYDGTAPRSYSVTPRTSLFCYKSASGGIEVYQYDGDITEDTVLSVPETIDGRTVVSIGEKFIGRSLAKTVILPDTVTRIDQSAFNSCTNLQTLTIPASVTEIGEFVFTNCTSLTNLNCSVDNPVYRTSGGILYNKDMTRLIAAPACSEVAIPKTVQTIGSYAFYYNSNLRRITIPATVTMLEEGAFAQCSALEQVIMKGQTTVGQYAFASSRALKSVAFEGNGAPIAEKAFHLVTANVCYPANNSSWTTELLQDYAGTLTWIEGHSYEEGLCVYCGGEDPDYVPEPGFLQGTLTTSGRGWAFLTLYREGTDEPVITQRVTTKEYVMEGVEPGTYTLEVSKKYHVSRTLTVTIVSGANDLDVMLSPLGDVSGDGKINLGDVAKVFSHVRKSRLLTDDYAFLCADYNGDGKINMGDVAKIYTMARTPGTFQ